MKAACLTILAMLICVAAPAASVTAVEPAGLADEAAVSRLVETPAYQQIFRAFMTEEELRRQLAAGARLSPRLTELIARRMAVELAARDAAILDVLKRSVRATYTTEEVEALISFYSSPVGASAMTKALRMHERVTAGLYPILSEVKEAIRPEIEAELRK